MRLGGGGFFSGLTDGEDLILYCYELAELYRQDPAVFRRKPISALLVDLYWTDALATRRQALTPPV